jgi:putative drug exporter of the RND superfamily
VALIATGTKSLQNGSVGQSARGYALLNQHPGAWPPEREYGYVHSDTLTTQSDAFQGAALDVAAAMRDQLGGETQFRPSADHHSVLVVGTVTRPFSVDALRAAVLAVGKGHPQVTVEQTGDVSASDARDRVVNSDLHRAEVLSVPVTLLVLLFAFGAVVAALVPVLLALTAVGAAFGLLGPISQQFPSTAA